MYHQTICVSIFAFSKMNEEELALVEEKVNAKIKEIYHCKNIEILPIAEATEKKAQ